MKSTIRQVASAGDNSGGNMNCGPNAIDPFRPALSYSSIHLEAMAGMRFEMVKYMTATVFVWLTTASQVLAHRPGGGGHGGHDSVRRFV